MRKTYTYLFISLFLSLSLQAQDYKWESAQFLQPNYSGLYAISRMDVSQTDEKVVLGYFRDSLATEVGTLTSSKAIGVFLAKYSVNDSLLWVKKITEAEEYIPVIYVPRLSNILIVKTDDLGHIYIGLNYNATLIDDSIPLVFDENCSYCSDFIIIKFDSEGNQLINMTVENTCSMNIDFDGIAIDEQGDVYVSGSAYNSPNIPEPLPICECIVGEDTLTVEEGSPFLAKFSSEGQGLWLTPYIGTSSIIELVDNFVYVGGVSSKSNIQFGTYTLEYPSNIDYGGYIAKFDTSGIFHWTKHFGVSGWDSHMQLLDIHAVSENDIVLLGRSYTQSVPNQVYFQDAPILQGQEYGTDDAFVVCYDSLGAIKWHDITGGTSSEWYVQVGSDIDKNIFISGFFTGTLELPSDTLVSTGSDDILLLAYDSLGTQLWAKSTGGSGLDYAYSMEMDSQNNLYLLGSTASQPIHFGEHTYDLTGSSAQVFLAKLMPNNIGLIEQVLDCPLTLYPNPNVGSFSISAEQPIKQVELYSVLGEQIFVKNYAKELKQVDLNLKLIPGIYFVLLQTEAGVLLAKKMRVE